MKSPKDKNKSSFLMELVSPLHSVELLLSFVYACICVVIHFTAMVGLVWNLLDVM